jgi:hypothetical protein
MIDPAQPTPATRTSRPTDERSMRVLELGLAGMAIAAALLIALVH